MGTNVHVSVNDRQTSTFLGMDNHILLSSEHTDGLVGAVDVSIQPGAGAPLHSNRREALMFYGIEGTITVDTEDGSMSLVPGDAIFVPKGRTHAFTNLTDRPARALLVCLPGGFEKFLLELSGTLPTNVPAGPPSPDVIGTLVTAAARYDVIVHAPSSV